MPFGGVSNNCATTDADLLESAASPTVDVSLALAATPQTTTPTSVKAVWLQSVVLHLSQWLAERNGPVMKCWSTSVSF